MCVREGEREWRANLQAPLGRGRLGAACTMEEMVDGKYELDEISSEKRAIMYLQV